MENTSLAHGFSWNTRIATLASFVLVSLMVAFIVSTLVVLIRLIYPEFGGGFLVTVSILIGLVASMGQRRLRGQVFPQPRWIAYRTAEFITIILVLRILSYWINCSTV